MKPITKGDIIRLKNVPGLSEKYIVTRVQPFVPGDLTVRFDIEPYPPITATDDFDAKRSSWLRRMARAAGYGR